ncbi:hypothetical protein KKJ06_12960 [Xenorhabdus bovienii]|nr:hypothetical protein [Xenorhabdus bovienii]MDE9551942.1 hypothetical protein [Xenorhabdus bovienii]MDE9556317.1 hypothetical protein [Xenorhabdus bovienii]
MTIPTINALAVVGPTPLSFMICTIPRYQYPQPITSLSLAYSPRPPCR